MPVACAPAKPTVITVAAGQVSDLGHGPVLGGASPELTPPRGRSPTGPQQAGVDARIARCDAQTSETAAASGNVGGSAWRDRAVVELDRRVALTHKQVFDQYVVAGAITRNPDAIAAMFTEDGVFEAPLVFDGHPLRRLVGRDAIRTGMSVYHQQPIDHGTMNLARSAYSLHDTPDPDVFIAEIDVAFDEADGRRTTVSQVKIFRVRDGQIAMLRDYFAELPPTASGPHGA